MTWSCIILAANILILVSAIRMRRLRDYSLAKVGAILAMIPCIGPCYLSGIPFGIWAIIISGACVNYEFRWAQMKREDSAGAFFGTNRSRPLPTEGKQR